MKFNATRAWSEQHQRDNGDCLDKSFVCTLPQCTHFDLQQNDTSELIGIWGQMQEEVQRSISTRYGLITSLLFVEVDVNLIRAAIPFWDPSYRCFSFNQFDLTPTIEEYMALLKCSLQDPNRIYAVRWNTLSPKKKLSIILGVIVEHLEQHFKKKDDRDCVSGEFLYEFAIAHLNDEYGVAAFILAIYGLVVFPRDLGYIDASVIDLVYELQYGVNPVPAILAETIRSLNHCRIEGKGRFNACLPLLYIWLKTHVNIDQGGFKKHQVSHDPIKEFCEFTWHKVPSTEDWVRTLQDISSNHIRWRAPWLPPTQILFKCGNYPWVPLLGITGGISYCPLLVIRQFGGQQFIPATHGLKDMDFKYWSTHEVGNIDKVINAWRSPVQMRAGQQLGNVSMAYEFWRASVIRNLNPQVEIITEPTSPVPAAFAITSEADLISQEFESHKRAWEEEKTRMETEIANLKMSVNNTQSGVTSDNRLKRDRASQLAEEQNRKIEEYNARATYWKTKANQERRARSAIETRYRQIAAEDNRLQTQLIRITTQSEEQCQSLREAYVEAISLARKFQGRNEETEARLVQNGQRIRELEQELKKVCEEKDKEKIEWEKERQKLQAAYHDLSVIDQGHKISMEYLTENSSVAMKNGKRDESGSSQDPSHVPKDATV